MIAFLQELVLTINGCHLSRNIRLRILEAAIWACTDSGRAPPELAAACGNLPPGTLFQDDSGQWYFRGAIAAAALAAAESISTLMDSSSEREDTEDTKNKEQDTKKEEYNINTKSRDVRAHAIHGSTVPVQGVLWPEHERRPRRRKAQPHDGVYRAIVEITESDDRPFTRSLIAKVARDLISCTPPYTPDEVRQLANLLPRQPWWALGMHISPQIILKHIGLVRCAATASQKEVNEISNLSPVELERRAIRSYRESYMSRHDGHMGNGKDSR